jgi:hypothetical protein
VAEVTPSPRRGVGGAARTPPPPTPRATGFTNGSVKRLVACGGRGNRPASSGPWLCSSCRDGEHECDGFDLVGFDCECPECS